jgi:hypothetical protein
MTTIRIPTGIFDDLVWVVAPVTYREAVKWLEEKKISDFENISEYEEARGLCLIRSKKSQSIIFLKKVPKSPETISILLHECIHAASDILSTSGVKEKENCEETLCYTAHYIFRKALQSLWKVDPESIAGSTRKTIKAKVT